MRLSVIIPVAKNDEAWRGLLESLRFLTYEDEVIFVAHTRSSFQKVTVETKKLKLLFKIKCPVRWILSSKGRAKQMNAGAREATNEFLWFLHCDSNFSKKNVLKLKAYLKMDQSKLYYFRLFFQKEASILMNLNTFGVRFRSEVLNLPFGDQGYCLHKDNFDQLGGFCEKAKYGEDHLLIWKAHQCRVILECIPMPIFTSARRYQSQGWANTTLKHIFLTYKQAIPEFFNLLQLRWGLK